MGNEQGRPLTEEEKRLQSIRTMDAEMRQKLGGLTPKYNMKIVIKGERNTGKSVLWKRLQQQPFEEAYVPTPEIQVATISWNYKSMLIAFLLLIQAATDELIKVEVWDVVDQGKKRPDRKLKLDNSTEEEEEEQDSKSGSYTVSKLDASTVNVYLNTNAVIIMVDPTKKWTFEYIAKELPKIPKDIDVLLLVNYMDMAEYRTIAKTDITSLIADYSDRSIYFAEASLKNNYGMKEIVSFFNIPFLRLKRQYLQQQLQQNQRDIENAINELHILNEEQNYQAYVQAQEELKKLKKKSNFLNLSSATTSPTAPPRSQEAPAALTQPAPLTKQDSKGITEVEVPSVGPWRRMSIGNRPPGAEIPAAAQPGSPPLTKQDSKGSIPIPQSTAKQDSKANASEQPTEASKTAPPAKTGNFFSRLFKSSNNLQEDKSPAKTEEDLKKLAMEARTNPKAASTNIDEFVPGELDNQFFGEDDSPRGKDTKKAKAAAKPADNDSDDENANPLVAADEEVQETRIVRPTKTSSKPSPKVTSSPKAAPKKSQYSDDEDAPNPFVTPDTEEPSPIKLSKATSKAKTQSKPVVQEVPPKVEEKQPPKKKTIPKKAPVDDDDESPNPLVAADELPDNEPVHKKTVTKKVKTTKASPAKPEPATVETKPEVAPSKMKAELTKQEPLSPAKPEPAPAKPETTPTKQQPAKQEPSPKQSKAKSQTKKAAPVVTQDEDDDVRPNTLVGADVEEEPPSKPAPRLKSKPKKQSAASPQKVVSDTAVTASSVEVTVPTSSVNTEEVSVPAKKEEKPAMVPEPVVVTPAPEPVTPILTETNPVKEEPKASVEVVSSEVVEQKNEEMVKEQSEQNSAKAIPKIDMEDEFFLIDNRSQGSRKSDSPTPSQVQAVEDFIPEGSTEDDFFGKDDEIPVATDPSFNKNSDDEPEDLSKSRIELSASKKPLSDVESLKDEEAEGYQVQRITGTTEGKDSEEDEPSKIVPRKFGSSIDVPSGRESAEPEVQQPKTIKVTLIAQAEDSEKATGESDEPIEEAYSGPEHEVEQDQEEEQQEEVEEPAQEDDPWAKLGITQSATEAAESDPWASFQSPAASLISTADSEDPWAQLGISTSSNADPFAALEQLPQEQTTSKSKKSSSKSSSSKSTTTTSKSTSSSSSKSKTQSSKTSKKAQPEEEEVDIWNTNPKKSTALDDESDDDIWNTSSTTKWDDDEPEEQSSSTQEKSKKTIKNSSSSSKKAKILTSQIANVSQSGSSSKSKKSGEESSKRKHKTKKSDQ